ncbi:MAG TPA: S1 RNA-binding domain-containing protein [Patescibacteria group bacterium]|nr:S1 RNA-binding domain-containing protein [Patescibacteria group bacterium]
MKSVQPPLVSLQKGSLVTGTIKKLTSAEILVDIGSKTDALVLEKDRNILRNILSTIKLGDTVQVSILNPESDFGNTVVSLRRFVDEKLWGNLSELVKSKKDLDVTVEESTRGGFVVSTADGISGFLPNSHAVGTLEVGQKTKATLLEFDKLEHKIIFSQKKIVDSDEFAKAAKSIKIEQKIDTTINSIAPFGIFVGVTLGDANLEGFIHISEISWDKIETVPPSYKIGDKLEAQVIGFDKKSSRVNLSIKRLAADPNIGKLKAYSVDKKVEGKVAKSISSGVLVDLPDGVEGFIKKDKIPVGTTYNTGSLITATVTDVDPKNHRVILTPYLTKKTIGYR